MKITKTYHLIGLLLCVLIPLNALQAQSLLHKQVVITGQWRDQQLLASGFQPRDADHRAGEGRVRGAVSELDRRRRMLRVGPVAVKWSGLSRFEGFSEAEIEVGSLIDVSGEVIGSGRLSATAIRRAPPDWPAESLQLADTVTRSDEAPDGTLTLMLFGLVSKVPLGVYKPGQALTRRLDERWSDDPETLSVFDRPLVVGASVEVALRHRADFELDADEDDDVTRFDQEFSVDLNYRLSEHASLFVEASAAIEVDLHAEDGDEQSEHAFELGEAWLFVDQLYGSNAALQVGRQNVSEPREWWWDADLDAARLFYDGEGWQLQFGIAEQLARVDTQEEFIDPEDDDLMRMFARGGWDWAEDQRLEVFLLHQNDHSPTPGVGERIDPDREDEIDADLWWLGLRASGEQEFDGYGKLNYWLDAALVHGDETRLDFDDDDGVTVVESSQRHKVRGWGADAGVSWTTEWPGEPTLTLSYAYGSGDRDPDDDVDRAFQQTGLHGNSGRFQGVNRFDYYGELLSPELSNLHILTAAIGLPLWRDSSVELIYHRYWQDHATDELRDARIGADPEGRSTDIGQELDLVIGIEEWDDLELELIGSAFEAGDAYGDASGERAYSLFFKLDYSF